MILLFFFFKQKTAYEMRISDWSSDVCSSDLLRQLLSLCCLAAQRLARGPVNVPDQVSFCHLPRNEAGIRYRHRRPAPLPERLAAEAPTIFLSGLPEIFSLLSRIRPGNWHCLRTLPLPLHSTNQAALHRTPQIGRAHV